MDRKAVTMEKRSDAHCHDFSPFITTGIYPLWYGVTCGCIAFHPCCCLYCDRFFHKTAETKRRPEQTVRNKPSSFSEVGRKALPLACCCLSERKARRPGARCPLSVHTLPSAASCFVTQHDSMGHRDGGALRSAADQLT